MCIDGLEFKGPGSEVFYKLPDRDKAFKQFIQCSMLLAPDMFQESPLLRAYAAAYKIKLPGKGLKGMAAYMREPPRSAIEGPEAASQLRKQNYTETQRNPSTGPL
jgi:hypothetical protein